MVKSIQYFNEKSVAIFEKLEDEFLRDPSDIASYVTKLTEELHIRILGNPLLIPDPLAAGGNAVQSPMDEHTETRLGIPLNSLMIGFPIKHDIILRSKK